MSILTWPDIQTHELSKPLRAVGKNIKTAQFIVFCFLYVFLETKNILRQKCSLSCLDKTLPHKRIHLVSDNLQGDLTSSSKQSFNAKRTLKVRGILQIVLSKKKQQRTEINSNEG